MPGVHGAQAIVDTGTSFCVGSPAVVSAVKAAIGAFRCDPVTWGDLPVLSFRFGTGVEGTRVNLQPEDYISVSASKDAVGEDGSVRTNATTCSLLFMSNPAVPDNWLVLGAPLFWRYYVAFNRTSGAVGFAPASPVHVDVH